MEEQDRLLIDKLVQKGLVSQDTIAELQARQADHFEQARQELAGTLYVIDPFGRKLLIQDLLTRELFKEIDLSTEGSPPLLPDPSANESVSVGLIDPESGTSSGWDFWEPKHHYGLGLTADDSFLYPPSLLEAEKLWMSRFCYCPLAVKYAYDLFLNEDHSLLLIADRHAGTIKVLDTAVNTILASIAVRPQGVKKAMNVSFDDASGAYLTDGLSSMLYYIDLESFEIEQIDMGLSGYALGNLALSPDGDHLYLLTIKPNISLLYLELETHELIRDVPIKGNLLSSSHDWAYDLFLPIPEQNYLLLMTIQDETDSIHPLINLIDTQKARVIQRYNLTTLDAPSMLVFPRENPLKTHQKTILELLIAEKLVSRQMLAGLKVVDLDGPDAPDAGQGAVPTLVPQTLSKLELPKQIVLPLMLSLLSDKIYIQTEIDLKHYPESWTLLEQSAEQALIFLETHDFVDVTLKDVLVPRTLSQMLMARQLLIPEIAEAFTAHLRGIMITVTRQEIWSLFEKHHLQQSPEEKHPEACPQCSNVLYAWDCGACGYEIENADRKQKKEQSSLTSASYAYSGHIPFADPARQRLLVLDQSRTLDWVLDETQLGKIKPWFTLWLPNKNLLVVDRDNNQIHELGPAGQIKWTLPQKKPESQLSFPVKASYFVQGEKELFLIVDQGNHRVLAVDRQGTLCWQYGIQGIGGDSDGHLDMPFDLQWTFSQTALIVDSGNNRVLETDLKDGRIVRCFGDELGLSGPVFAQRLYNHHTLIVDAGNYRVIEVDLDGDPVNECFYFRDDMGMDMRIDLPTFVMRGDRQNLILMDEDKMIELLPEKRRLVWSSLLEHLVRRIEIISDTQEETGERYTQSFYQYRMFNMDELVVRLRKRALEYPDEANSKLMQKFTQLLEIKREIDSRREELSKAKDYHQSFLLDIPLWSIDRTHHFVMQINRKGQVGWYFGSDSAVRLQRPAQISETETSVLIADTGNQRVLEVLKSTSQVLLSIGGKTDDILNQPRSATRTLSGNTLVADQGHRRLVEFNSRGQEVWVYKNPMHVVSPYFAAEQGTGTILYADWALQMVKEIRRDGTLIWAYGQSRRVGSGANQLSSPEYAVRLASGSTLIADTHNDRVIEVSPNQQILWEYRGSEKNPLIKPCHCKRLADGHTLIACDNYRQLIEVDEEGYLCWSFVLGSKALIKE